MRAYTGGLAKPLNARLRNAFAEGTELSSADRELVSRIDAGIKAAGVYEERPVVYRGLLLGHREGMPNGADLVGMSAAERERVIRDGIANYAKEKFAPGTVFSGGGGYQSTGFDVRPALDASITDNRVGVILEIRARSGAYLGKEISQMDDEAELLLGRETEYRVHKVIPAVKFDAGVREEVRTVIQVEQIK